MRSTVLLQHLRRLTNTMYVNDRSRYPQLATVFRCVPSAGNNAQRSDYRQSMPPVSRVRISKNLTNVPRVPIGGRRDKKRERERERE